jgi:hypothetical protein
VTFRRVVFAVLASSMHFELIGVPGRWAEMENQCQFRTRSGAVLNYWKTTGTIYFQGTDRAASELRAMLLRRAIVIE